MKYYMDTAAVIDVTKPPYCADPTGQVDCTHILRQIFDDVLSREVEGILATERRVTTERLDLDQYYIGFENRRWREGYSVIYPEFVPDSRIIYFPAGTYLVSDTVTYTIKNLQNRHWSKPYYELTRGIRLVGEGMDQTVIRLKDHSAGFEAGKKKAVVSYINVPEACEQECSNVSQLNVFADMTVDCGSGNEGAIALRFVSNNSGNVENVRLTSNGSHLGLQLPVATEGTFRNLEISGFEWGVFTSPESSICMFDGLKLDRIQKACLHSNYARANLFRNVEKGDAPMFLFEEGIGKQFVFDGASDVDGELKKNLVYPFADSRDIPFPVYDICKDSVAFVDDYGAIGDGKTDSTGAIQAAMNSGKPHVFFGGGHYLVNGKIFIPASVQLVDFMYCDLFSGGQLISGELDSLFVIAEDSDQPLTMRNLYTFEQFYGNFRLINHHAHRNLYMKNLHTQAASMYFNTVSGSRVYLDNCACTTATYSMDTILRRGGYAPVFSRIIPYEFHGQTVVAYQLNPERADVELLNDGSELTIYGYKVEGPGTATKTVNGGKTVVYGFSAGIGNSQAENALFYSDSASHTEVYGGIAFWGYQCIFEKNDARYMTDGYDPLHFDIVDDQMINKEK